jgi:hypothetical protein
LIACAWVWCRRCVVEQHYVTHPSVQLTQRSEATEATTKRTNANRQRSKLAEASQEGEKGRGKESEKWVTRPRGGRSKNENDRWEGKKSEKRFKKT